MNTPDTPMTPVMAPTNPQALLGKVVEAFTDLVWQRIATRVHMLELPVAEIHSRLVRLPSDEALEKIRELAYAPPVIDMDVIGSLIDAKVYETVKENITDRSLIEAIFDEKMGDYDPTQHMNFNDAVDDRITDHDFGDAISTAVDNHDFEYEIESALDNYALDDKIKDKIKDACKDLTFDVSVS